VSPADAALRAAALLAPLRSRGGAAYLGEPVTQLEHACQTAQLAVLAGASDAAVVAALLHDVGWLLPGTGPDDSASSDARVSAGASGDHALRGAAWLGQGGLPAEVTEPIRLHVEAKRWLCATSPEYYERLSDASRATLARQGGAHDAAGRRAFEAEPFADLAVRLRRWDDDAKVPGRAATLHPWTRLVEAVLMSG
jgi:predicted HD phosphohydrolase